MFILDSSLITQDTMSHRSQSFAYGTRQENANNQKPIVYSALLSRIAIALRQRIVLADHIKDDIEYKNTFEGKQVVVCSNLFSLFISLIYFCLCRIKLS